MGDWDVVEKREAKVVKKSIYSDDDDESELSQD